MRAQITNGSEISSIMPDIQYFAMTLDKLNAEDISQDVAVKLLSLEPSDRLLGHFGCIATVVKNTAIDRWRKEAIERKYVDRTISLDITGSVAEGADERRYYTVPARNVAEEMETYLLSIVKEKLKKLPKQQRQALVLHAAGYSYREIATMTGASVGTVSSRIHYARIRAQALLRSEL